MTERHLELAEVTSLEDYKEMQYAAYVGDWLQEAYPDYLWYVNWQGGAIVVKCGQVGAAPGDCNYGMILDDAERYSISALKKDAVMKGGELLERAGLARGRWNGDMSKYLDKA